MAERVERVEGLVVEAVDGGLVLYDPRCSQAHWLDPEAAAVWRACGRSPSGDEVASIVGGDRGPVAATLVRLEELGLVRVAGSPGVSRRSVLVTAARVGAAGAVAAPIISAVIPSAAAAASTPTMGGGGTGTGNNPPPPPPALMISIVGSGYTLNYLRSGGTLGSKSGSVPRSGLAFDLTTGATHGSPSDFDSADDGYIYIYWPTGNDSPLEVDTVTVSGQSASYESTGQGGPSSGAGDGDRTFGTNPVNLLLKVKYS